MTLPLQLQRVDNTRQLVTRLLDQGYTEATTRVLQSIDRNMTTGLAAQRLTELEAEAQRLADLGERLQPDNPVLRAVTADLEQPLRRSAGLVDAASGDVQTAGTDAAGTLTRELALPGLNDGQLRSLGIRWGTPDPEAVQALVNYSSSPAFADSLARYPAHVLDTIQNIAVRGIVDGRGPLATARDIRRVAQDMPLYQANSAMRTLQLESYRTAAVAHQVANASIIDYVIRVETLDSRICVGCIALHGTTLRIDQKLEEHDQGRGVGVPVVRGRQLNVQSGVDWFNQQSEERQRAQMGHAAYEAWKADEVQIQDFAGRRSSPIYGDMMQVMSLKGLLGENARAFYKNAV